MRLRSLPALALSALLTACAAAEPQPASVAIQPAAGADAPLPPPPPTPPPPSKSSRPQSLPGTSIRFTGGDGSSLETAIVIEGAKGEMDGVPSEYRYLEMLLGPQGTTWKRTQQSLLNKNGRHFDLLEIEHMGKAESYYFDITGYFGK